ncbi:hypothetical protein PG911_10510 [Tenacibaculum ovolyticum]|uniref:hypothetical protein n=1 Tax=Tenacibaculum ovolyticum TaxID=104270 RepID=UPI0007EC853D|nr:hypothetical protein [Tenacibaculum ovolyticum]WBX75089.1 hypothetical protein PG911_10510 [Tenacibaculum ovolyticum]
MQDYKKTKIKASSLHESVVSIVIISLAISIGMIIFINVTNNIYNQVSYHQLLNKIDLIKNESSIIEDEKNKESYSFKGYNIVKTIKEEREFFFLEVIVFKNEKVILKKEFIRQK